MGNHTETSVEVIGTIHEVTLGDDAIVEARGWLSDCFGDEEIAELSDQYALLTVNHHFEGGIVEFLRSSYLPPFEKGASPVEATLLRISGRTVVLGVK